MPKQDPAVEVEDPVIVESPVPLVVQHPHGPGAEANDVWVGARWAPHGDQNVPAESYGPDGVLGEINPAAADQARGIEGDSDADVKRAKREAGPGVSIARERYEENEAARRIAAEEG